MAAGRTMMSAVLEYCIVALAEAVLTSQFVVQHS